MSIHFTPYTEEHEASLKKEQLLSLEKEIEKLNECYNDVHALVNKQDDTLREAVQKLNQTVEHTQLGHNELEQAQRQGSLFQNISLGAMAGSTLSIVPLFFGIPSFPMIEGALLGGLSGLVYWVRKPVP